MPPTSHRSTRDPGLRPSVIVRIALVFGLFLSGCASREGSPSSTSSPSPSSASKSGSKFVPATPEALAPFREVDLHLDRLVSAGKNVALSPANPITLRLAAVGRLAGKSAVNRFFGTYELAPDGTIKWPNAALGMTRMAGPEAAMELEYKFASVLTASQRLVVSSDTLRFESNDRSHVADFKK